MPVVRIPDGAGLRRVWSTLVGPPWRDPLIAAVTFVLGTVYYVTDLQEVLWQGGPGEWAWQSYVLFVGLCVTEIFRGRTPRGALRVGLGLFAASLWFGTSLPIVLVVCDLLYASVLYGPRRHSRRMVWAVGLIVPIVVLIAWLGSGDWRIAVIAAVSAISATVLPVWWAMQVRLNREMAERERARADQLRRLAELDRRAAVASERSRMARDLHDVIAGHLSAIAIQSEAVLSMAENADSGGGDPAARQTVNTVLRSVRENSVQALNEMRTMIGLLRGDDDSDPHTSPPRLRELDPLIESARAGGVRLEVIGDPAALPDLPAAVDLVAYRIVQEALTNVVKHAPGAAATLRVEQVDHQVEIDVRNESTGAHASTDSGTGLASMRERAQSVGGSVTADRDGNVWRVHARLPLRELDGLGGDA